MRLAHGSALSALLLLCGCGQSAEPDVVHSVVVHLPERCTENLAPLSIQLEALGDFEASALTSETVAGNERGTELRFPAGTESVDARGVAGRSKWQGIGDRTPRGNVDVLLWPEASACPMWQASDAPQSPFPSVTEGVALGISERERLVLAVGGLVGSSDAARALWIDLDTGEAAEVEDGLLPGRAFATVTELGEGALLVAGGVDPTVSPDLTLSPPLDSAAVFYVDERRFDRNQPIQLSVARARHAAVVLADGSTLLVGGSGPTGVALPTLEVISPLDKAAKIAGLATLERARVSPVALTLEDGRVFVGGGLDFTGHPVGLLEWLSPDATSSVSKKSVGVAPVHAFVALPGSSVLGVGVCATPPACADDACLRAQCGSAVAWIRADGSVDALPPLSFTPDAAALIAASDGSPWLSAQAGAGAPVLLRFDPWSGRFATPADCPARLPPPSAPHVTTDPGAFVWLDSVDGEPTVLGFRHGIRGAFTRDVAPLLLAGAEHMVPDRAALGVSQTGVVYDGAGLSLAAGARATLTETLYGVLTLDIALSSGPPPVVRLGTQPFGGADCPWPDGTDGTLTLKRTEGSVVLSRGDALTACEAPAGLVPIAVEGASSDVTVLRSITVRRQAE